MNKTESLRYIETVNGTIIGDVDASQRGQLFHQGRAQGGVFTAATDAELVTIAKVKAEAMKQIYGSSEYARLYPNGLELRIWD
jgi:hypothetical protein